MTQAQDGLLFCVNSLRVLKFQRQAQNMFDLNSETMISVIFFWRIFAILQKIFSKMKYSVRSSSFSLKTIRQIFYNCLQHEKVLKILYFHIFNIAKFGKIYVWTITNWATSWSWKIKTTAWFSPRILRNNLSRFWAFFIYHGTNVGAGSLKTEEQGLDCLTNCLQITNSLTDYSQTTYLLPLYFGVRSSISTQRIKMATALQFLWNVMLK